MSSRLRSRRTPRWDHRRSIRATPTNRRDSRAVRFAWNIGPDALEEATRLAHRQHRHVFDALVVLNDTHLLPGLETQGLTDAPWNDDLELRRDNDGFHTIVRSIAYS